MKRKIKIPESHADITLGQFLKYSELKARENMVQREFDKRKVMIFIDIDYHDVEKIEVADYLGILKWIDEAMETDAPFIKRFELGGKEFGFIPNLDEIQAKEYFDLKMYDDKDENLHKIMAILFRPITGEDKLGNYDIESYHGTGKYAELMKELPMSIVFGALFFFRNLRTELSEHILLYSEVVRQKEDERRSSLRNGVGIRRFMNWLKGKHGSSNTLRT